MKRLGTKNEDLVQVFEWFKAYVTGTKLDVGIEHNELVSSSDVFWEYTFDCILAILFTVSSPQMCGRRQFFYL